ncbi:MAG: Hpt domain-containing protein [Halieaceae bacterium]|jgi:chemosensory pili system protein ChpA (sensor histidine kinase/response regulator)|nr:Hpt domain-containing protein [Halieaceae bacterium]
MTQHFDFVALGWVEKYLREEMDTARHHLHAYQHEPDEIRHLREALRNVHSATGVLKLCALDPAALLTQEIERVIGQLIVGKIAGEARKLAMTELAAAMEALPAYLANVRAKREVSAGVIANVINDLRHFGNRPALPDSLFFNPALKPTAGITSGQQPAADAKLKQFGARAMRVCAQYSKAALKKDRDALKQLFAVGKHATPLLAGSQMEPYFRCHMGLIEALAQPYGKSDEVILDVFKNTFAFLKSLALTGEAAVEDANPTPYIKKMLYYIAKTPAPTALQQGLRDTFDVQNVDDVGVASAGRLIQEDDLLEALNHTMTQLLGVMEFMTSQHREICSSNQVLVGTIVPQLRQVGLQLKAIGLNTHADTISQQYEVLKGLSERDEPAPQADLLDFGGALVAVKENLEHKLKHGLSAEGDSMGHDLDSAIMAQTFRCLNDMKSSINREFARQDLTAFVADDSAGSVSVATLRPVHRAASLVDNDELQSRVAEWEKGELPTRDELQDLAKTLLAEIPENSYAEQAAADMEQVVSVLSLMEDKQRESAILNQCIKFIRDSIGLGGLVNDAGMACFAEAIAALEQFMERRTEDPLGNADDHLDRGEARARMLASYVEQRATSLPAADNVVQFGSAAEDTGAAELEIADSDEPTADEEEEFGADLDDQEPASSVSMELEEPDEVQAAVAATPDPEPVAKQPAAQDDGSGTPWREALEIWVGTDVDRGPDAPLENPDADIDEELVECFVEEARKYVRKLEDAAPLFAEELTNEKYTLDIRAVFHTMKGSARTIELHEFGEFMYDMEKVYNALRDGYIKPTPEIAELLQAVTGKLPAFVDLLMQRVPLYTADFSIPHQIAASISEKRFDPSATRITTGQEDSKAAEPAEEPAAETEPADSAPSEAPAAEAVAESDPEAPPEEGDAVPGTGDAWSKDSTDAIIEALSVQLKALPADESNATHSASALILLHAAVPVLKELSDEHILGLDDNGLAHMLQLHVLHSAAANGDSGTMDAGGGAPVLCKLSNSTVEGVKRYLKTLEADGADGDAHAELEAFVRKALGLPGASGVQADAMPADDDDELADIELQPDPFSGAAAGGQADFNPEDIPITEPPAGDPDAFEEQMVEGDPLSPKLDGASEPEQALGSERADSDEDDLLDLGLGEGLDDFELGSGSLPAGSLDLDEELGALNDAYSDDIDFDLSEDDLPEPELEEIAMEAVAEDVVSDDFVEEVTMEAVAEFDEEPAAEAAEVAVEIELTAAAADIEEPEPETSEAAEAQADTAEPEQPEPVTEAAAEQTEASDNVVEFPIVDIDMELLEIFLETLDDSIEVVDTAVASLSTDDGSSLQKLKNTLHTLKGGANSIGLRNYGQLVHEFESELGGLEVEGKLTTPEGQSAVYAQVDLLHEASDFVKRKETDWGVEVPEPARADSDGEEPETEEEDITQAVSRVDSIRVGTGKIDRLLDVGLEVSMSNVRTRRALDKAMQDRLSVQGLARRVEEIVDKLSLQLDTEIQAKTESVPHGESFDPLEMDRLTEKQGLAAILREAAFDLHEEAKGLGDHVQTAMSEAISSSRLIEGSQSDLRLLRLVSFSRLGPGFRRLVNQVSRQLGKQVDFDLTCDDGGLDVSVFEQVKTALEHMLRNSVDHGIELPEERRARGKSESGKVSLIIYRQAAEFVIRLMDDGKGLAPETLRRKAVERGIIGEDERISEDAALQLIFHAGLSTAEKVTDISGRGVGMDVVQQSIAQIGGSVEVSSKPGFYTQFDIRVPASIMVNGALLATIGEEEVAVPLTSLDGSDFRHRDDIAKAMGNSEERLSFRNEQYEVRYLGTVRGGTAPPPHDTMPDFVPVLFARHGRRRVAFFADSVTNAEELVIRSLGAQFTGVPGIAGGSLKSDGQPVLALDLNELIRQVDYADSLREEPLESDDNRIVVLCVDDSVMMRRTYEKRLSSLNYDVVTAEDGEAALDYLAEAVRPPDFIFTDLEMPNMNGFDFIANMRRLPVMADVPTVVVSSRDGDKHRAEANKVGATDFMAKGSNSAEGMQAMIQRYLGGHAMAS